MERRPAAAHTPPPALGGDRLALLDRYFRWVDRLPGRGWWVPVVIAVALLAWAQAVLWISGRVSPWALDPTAVEVVVYGPYTLLALSVAHWVAQRALVAFWPATGWPEADRPAWAEAFRPHTAGLGWIAIGAGLAGGIGSMLLVPATVFGSESERLATYVAYGPAFLLGYGLLPVSVGIAFRWLRLVARIHRQAEALDPFDDGPIFAFSRLTVAAGIAYEVSTYYSFTVNQAIQAGNVVSILFLGVSTVFGVVVFVAPLWGIHDRLVQEKESRILQVEQRLEALQRALFERVDSGNLADTDRINNAVNAATVLRERVARLPTWPWPPQLFRGFVTALLLPVVVYALTRLVTVQFGV